MHKKHCVFSFRRDTNGADDTKKMETRGRIEINKES